MSVIGIAIIISLAVLLVIIKWINRNFVNPWEYVSKMGHMKFWWIFGYERWGEVKPCQMEINSIVYKPLFLGLWIRERIE
jgi:hypothetical protein